MLRLEIPALWWGSSIRHEMIADLCTVYADGIAVNIWSLAQASKADKHPLTRADLITYLGEDFGLDTAEKAGLVTYDEGGAARVAFMATVKSSAHVKGAPDDLPQDTIVARLEAIFLKYPKRLNGGMNKKYGMTCGLKKFRTAESLDTLEHATETYAAGVKSGKEPAQFVPMWSTWINGRWADFEKNMYPPKATPEHDPFKDLRQE